MSRSLFKTIRCAFIGIVTTFDLKKKIVAYFAIAFVGFILNIAMDINPAFLLIYLITILATLKNSKITIKNDL